MEPKLPLHVYQVHQSFATINKIHTLFFFISLLSLLYYRFSILFQRTTSQIPILPWLLITMSEFLLSLYWILAQAYRWRPVSRTVFTERLPNNEDLPPIDVFIFTCDPMKEPTVGVMNTVISALCIDYPPEKLFVYLSDDGGAPITLYATREAYNFAKKWAPFCKKYGIKTIAPEAYFSKLNDEEHPRLSSEFLENLEEIKSRYKVFKQLVEKAIQSDESCLSSSGNRSACIEVMRENATDEFLKNKVEVPHLVYVSREKRSNCHHKFKAGAINVLLRVSGIISNSPCILFLDCDMYCNDPMSARQAMCFHLDPQISSSLAFVQYPQTFHNVSKNDIYNTPMRTYIDLFEGKKRFGPSDAFLASIYPNQKQIFIDNNEAASNTLIEEATVVASCTYEEHTKWGKQASSR
ncbi:Cellulose synthase-like protein e1 [Thalictrum thalictroides]|uniref:Cellulose synthase-like protein e1 n=1 Tax=Thalictrum thalictroides TaxID=46969 RepID=A0A7J6X0L2_THATH|nr:Cellulose synthase-like protein e1 [Thalictrum thalictroides]